MSTPVLIIASAYPPENVIGALRPGRFAHHLPNSGYRPIVITCTPQPNPKPDVFHVPFQYGLTEQILSKTLMPGDEHLTWISPVVKKAESLIRDFGIKLVFSTSPPIGVHLIGAALKRRCKVKWVADFRDAFAGNYHRVQLACRVLDPHVESYLAQRMDLAILNTDMLAEHWKARYPFLKDRIRALYNGFDPHEEIGPLPLPQRPHQVWLQAGSIYSTRYPDRLFAAMERLRQSKHLTKEVQLNFFGYIPHEVLALPSYQKLIAASVMQCNPNHVPQAEARRQMAQADGLVVFDHYSQTGNMHVPAKTYDYIQIGRPILAFSSPGSPLDRLLQQSGIACTIVYEEDSPEVIDRKLVEYSHLPREPRPPSDYFLNGFNVVNQTKRLAGMFDDILKG